MLIQFFIILLVASVGSLYMGLKYKKWLLTMFSTVLFGVLAFSAFRIEVVTGGVNLVFQEIALVLLMWLGTFAGFIFTLVGMVDHLRTSRGKKKNPGGYPGQYGGG